MSNALTTNNDIQQPATQQQGGALADLRAMSMSVDIPTMQQGLAQYAERRQCFRDWLKSQLVEGVHYGIPPGCEPKYDEDGNLLIKMRGSEVSIPPHQWQAKPSLYKAGAAFVVDLLGVRVEFKADIDSWKQLGEPKGTFVIACYLFSRATGELLGEGRGVRSDGQKGGDKNNAIKMAEKCALVDAVLNAYGLADLFTQDHDTPPDRDRHDNPDQATGAPRAGTRRERLRPVTPEQIKSLLTEWKANRHDDDATKDKWTEWVMMATGVNFDVAKASQWSQAMVVLCEEKLQAELGGAP